MHVIPEQHKQLLLKALGTEHLPEVPKPVADSYWRIKSIWDRLSYVPRDAELRMALATILMNSNLVTEDNKPGSKLPRCLKLIKEGKAKTQKCLVRLGGQLREAIVTSVDTRTARVVLQSDTEPYRDLPFGDVCDIDSPFAELGEQKELVGAGK